MGEPPRNDPPLPHLTGKGAKTLTAGTVRVTTRTTTRVVIARPLVLFLVSLTLLSAVFVHGTLAFTPILYLPGQGDLLVRSVAAVGILLLFGSIFDCVLWVRNAKKTPGK